MQVDKATLSYIENVVATAKLVGIDNIIIEPDRVRALDDDSTVVLLQTEGVPILPFGSLGLNRLGLFSSRYEIAKGADKFEMNVDVAGIDTQAPYARALTMKGKGIKIDYRCANPATIRAPKAFANDVVKYRARMHPEAVVYMMKGSSAMETQEVSLIGTKDSVSFELVDVNSDKMSHVFGDTVENVQPNDSHEPKFAHRYPVKLLQTVFKPNSDSYFYITARGMLKIAVNGLDIYVLART
jgi:hypothetical protein